MAPHYAKEQPKGFKNHVENIAIVGAGGRSGRFIAEALMMGGRHRVTAITRTDSTNQMPPGVHETKQVNYDSRLSLVEALRGQDVLVITMGVMAPKESQTRLIDAAVEAGVRWILPNDWGVDHTNENLANDTMLGARYEEIHAHVETVGGDKTHWIGVSCSFWYEFSLAGSEARFGFDFDKKEVTFFDSGNEKVNTTTWPQVGRAVARLLSLKVSPEDESDHSPCLSQFNNRSVYISSFLISQRDMLDSVLRVTGDNKDDWKACYEDVKKRFKRGSEMMKQANMTGFAILLYSRIFFKNGGGNVSHKLDNEALGLPEEDLDEATKVAVEMAQRGETNMH
ncbi:hypothetical protein LTR37_002935 [Vermiconidia calcicola]|uniref:Uncharacterized protein n=1 Tax=Vermiconidia calcicola TaxID=1690605 RepID=A0ACC3NU65_9PEZI|nr:hypothetical protein LTR37_002935 [Vermiconidia calcicola]